MAKKLDINLEELEELASKGYSVEMLCSAIGIAKQTAYNNKYIMDAIRRGHSTAKQKVVNDLMNRSEVDQSSTASIFLAKQLKVFDNYYPTASPKSPTDALNKISNIYTAVSRNELSEEKGTALIGYLEKYVKAYEMSELEKRITKIEDAQNVK